jgi:methionyl-tRNA formyltransferase
MRIAFFGTPDFAVSSLKKLVENKKNIVAVITAPDKPSGRGLQLQSSEVKQYAESQNLNILQPTNLKSEVFLKEFEALQVDIAVVVAFRMMPEVLWSLPKYGTFNLHGSLLPKYRGAAPINWAIINGEKETGVTTFFINTKIDTGELILQDRCEIKDSDDFGTLYNQLKEMGATLVLKTIDAVEKQTIKTIPQDLDAPQPLAPKIDKDLLHIQNFESAEQIFNLVRGLNPVYKPYFTYNDKKYIIKKGYVIIDEVDNSNDLISTDHKTYLYLNCKKGMYAITEIQAEGKKSMDIVSFFNGNKLT